MNIIVVSTCYWSENICAKSELFFKFSQFFLLVNIFNLVVVTGVLPPCPHAPPQRVQVKCAELSFHHKYRTYDGSCNNFEHTQWGAAATPLLRLLPAQYEDALEIPIGDIRANEQLMLTTLHTILLREHNRIARKLARINPEWNGETTFQETRKIVGALIQKITYHEWLPKILGPIGMEMLGQYEGYDDNVNPGIANGVATAALRFGHALVPPALKRLTRAFRPDVRNGDEPLRGAFFVPESLVRNGGTDPLIRGAVGSPVKDIQSDTLVNGELTDHLFPNAHSFPLDLAAMNIQRGREHALPAYNDWRQLCGLTKIQNWQQMKAESRDARHVNRVAEIYGQTENIDLWVGGLLEKPLRGGKLGRTFTCLVADQFKRLRQGDRMFIARLYMSLSAGLMGQLPTEIRKATKNRLSNQWCLSTVYN